MQPAENADLLLLIEAGLVVAPLHLGLQPLARFVVLAMHVLHANMAAVGLLKRSDDIAQFHLPAALEVGERERVIKVRFVQSKMRKRKLRVRRRRLAQGIQMRLKMAMCPVRVDQPPNLGLLQTVDDANSSGLSAR